MWVSVCQIIMVVKDRWSQAGLLSQYRFHCNRYIVLCCRIPRFRNRHSHGDNQPMRPANATVLDPIPSRVCLDLIRQQYWALLVKRFHYLRRSKKSFIVQVTLHVVGFRK